MAAQANWKRLYPFASHWLDLAGARLHYLDERPPDHSAADTLLFVHGNPTWSFHWRRLIVAWRGGFRCVAPDHLGCGLSDPLPSRFRLADRIDHLVTLIDELDLHHVTLIAQDWGGPIGLGAALRRADRFRRVVLFNTGAFPPWHVPMRILLCRTPLLGRWAVQGANLFCRAALRMTLARKARLAPEVAAGYLAPYGSWRRRQAVYDFVEDIPRTPAHPTWQTLEGIHRRLHELAGNPILLVWGMRDWCFTPECLDRFLESLPNAQVQRLEEAGHWVLEDAPDEARRAVEQFLHASIDQPACARHAAQPPACEENERGKGR